ncbi:unnamed protein product [Dibothriocephalus latus]|uniref:G-protein coupled receptors family 1 profile domain-containing protein n=1 Tax=Dibothriocephalus latus TaxID=60516 RepID=A0A3P7MBH5_DIBLA|nr:unnamed protein product [Dibothriocephalus latus]
MNRSIIHIPDPSISYNCTPIPIIQLLSETYKDVHVYFVLIWCPIGVFSNILNVVVLNQKSMQTPTNFLLTSLAISDGLIMFLYIPFTSYFIYGEHMTAAAYPMAIYLILYVNLQNLLHIFSCGIIVTLAVFRLIYAKYLLKCQEWCSHKRAVLAVGITLFTATFFTIPCIIGHRIFPVNEVLPEDGSTVATDSALDTFDERYMVNYVQSEWRRRLLYWNAAVIMKLAPLFCFIFLSSLLIATMHARVRHARSMSRQRFDRKNLPDHSLMSQVSSADATENPLRRVNEADKIRERLHSRTTHLLLALMIIYILAFIPQVILLLMSFGMGICFSETVYDPLGNLMDLLTLLSCGTNFWLYCIMSQQFRITFLKLFCPKRFSAKAENTQ